MSNELINPVNVKRKAARDSLFLTAEVRAEGANGLVNVRVRNLSPGGMMIDSSPVFHEGAKVTAHIRGIGDVTGHIAWIMEERAGVAFDAEIDPRQARKPVSAGKPDATFIPPVAKSRRPGLKIP